MYRNHLPNGNFYYYNPYSYVNPYFHHPDPYYHMRQQAVKGQATWTEGGPVTKCGIAWSDNEYMTAAVGTDTPYQCGQTLKIRNLSSPVPREILVEVVDRVQGYPANRINLHRKAFLALGANLDAGVLNVEITPSPQVAQEEWGKYLLGVAQSAYPGYNVVDYKSVGKTQISPNRTKQTYEFILQSPQEKIKVQANVIYDPATKRVISFDVKEI